MTQLSSKNVITRKEHHCFSCYKDFPKGTKMNYQVGIYEGNFCAVYSCETCIDIMALSDEHEFEEGYVSEALTDKQTPETMLKQLIHMDIISKLRIGGTVLVKVVGNIKDNVGNIKENGKMYSGRVYFKEEGHFSLVSHRNKIVSFPLETWSELECHIHRIVLTEKTDKALKFEYVRT